MLSSTFSLVKLTHWQTICSCFVVMIWQVTTSAVSNTKTLKEDDYCQFDTFNPSCLYDEVIVMENANYGRMKKNSCVKNDFGYIGCQMDVLPILNQLCSGSRICQYSVYEFSEKVQPCPTDLKSYLSAKYSCLKVVNYEPCKEPKIITLTDHFGYISSYYAFLNGTGSHTCPVLISGEEGQKVNITVYNYVDYGLPMDNCPYHIIIKDGDYVEKMSLCNKIPALYTSASTSLRIFFSGRPGKNNRHLIKYNVVGCKPLKPPGEAMFEVVGEGRGAVKCGQTVWYVTCMGTKWTGKVGNCSKSKEFILNKNHNANRNGQQSKHYPIGLVLAVGIGLILGLMLGAFLLICVLVRKRGRRNVANNQKTNTLLGGDTNTYDSSDEHYYRHPCQANNCDGRCLAPTTYCGQQTHIYNPPIPTNAINYELQQHQQTGGSKTLPISAASLSQPCHAHSIYETRNLQQSQLSNFNSATLPNNNNSNKFNKGRVNNEKFAQILTSTKSSASKQPTTFSTFKPPSQSASNSDSNSLYEKFGTYPSRRGILKLPSISENGTICTCESNDNAINDSNQQQPDVIRNSDTGSVKKPSGSDSPPLKENELVNNIDTNNVNQNIMNVNHKDSENKDDMQVKDPLHKIQTPLLPKTNNSTANT